MDKKPRILVIDDVEAVGKQFEDALSTEGYAVETAASGEEALEVLKNRDIALVFSNIKMPDMNGIEIAENIKNHHSEIPVVLIKDQPRGDGFDVFVLGVGGYVDKPLSTGMIGDITRKALKAPPVPAEENFEEILSERPRRTAPAANDRISEDMRAWHSVSRIARNIGLFFAAPFVAIGYMIALPLVGFYMFAKLAVENQQKKRSAE